MFKKSFSILLSIILLAGCQSGFNDLSRELHVLDISQISIGKYAGIAWVNKTTLVLEVDEGNLFENQRMCVRETINIYEMKTKQLRSLPLPFDGDCRSYIIRDLQVLPNQQAAYIFEYPKLNSLIIKAVDVSNATEKDFIQNCLVTLL